jgi:hypothetical protein
VSGDNEHMEHMGADLGGDMGADRGGGEALSLRDSLNEAFEAARDGEGEGLPAPGADEGARDARGPSAAPASEPASSESQAPAAPEAHDAAPRGAPPEPIQPPASWSAPAKAAFASLSPIVQSEIAKREADVNRGFEERAAQLKRFEPLEQILEPRRERLAARGVSDVDFVKTLFAASDWIDRDPVSALRELMRQKGVTAQHLGVTPPAGQQPPSPNGHGAAQLPPAYVALAQQVHQLQTHLSQRDQAERAHRLQSVQSEIQAFAADSANLYFANVRDDMIALLQSGRAADLRDAYDKAVWANPETRALLQADAAKKAEADRLNAQRQSAAGARRAAGSVVGAPVPGSSPAGAGHSTKSLREEIADSYRAHRA